MPSRRLSPRLPDFKQFPPASARAARSFAAPAHRRYTLPLHPRGHSSMIEKIFKAYDVRATYPNPLNEEAAWKVGHATGLYLQRSRQNPGGASARVKMESTVVVGRDMRPHCP